MSHKKGAYLCGIRTLDDLRQRCFMDTESGCWIWRGGMSHGFPCVALSMASSAGTRTQSMRGQRAVQILAGRTLSTNDVAHPYRCRNNLCMNPTHGGVKSRTKHWDWMRANGLCASNLKHKAATVKRNKERAIVTPEMIEVMRSTDEPCVVVARRLGISPSSVSNYRRGVNGGGKSFGAASVFTWRPEA